MRDAYFHGNTGSDVQTRILSINCVMVTRGRGGWTVELFEIKGAPCVHILAAGCTGFKTCAPRPPNLVAQNLFLVVPSVRTLFFDLSSPATVLGY